MVCYSVLPCVSVCYSALQRISVCCHVFQCVVGCCRVFPCLVMCCRELSCVADNLPCVAACRRVLLCVAMCFVQDSCLESWGSCLSVDRPSLLQKCLKIHICSIPTSQVLETRWVFLELIRKLKAWIYKFELSWVPNELLTWLGPRNPVTCCLRQIQTRSTDRHDPESCSDPDSKQRWKQKQISLSGMFWQISFIANNFLENRNRNRFVPVTFESLTICDIGQCDPGQMPRWPNLFAWKPFTKSRASARGHKFEIVTFCDCHKYHKWSHIECNWYKPCFWFCVESGSELERLWIRHRFQTETETGFVPATLNVWPFVIVTKCHNFEFLTSFVFLDLFLIFLARHIQSYFGHKCHKWSRNQMWLVQPCFYICFLGNGSE